MNEVLCVGFSDSVYMTKNPLDNYIDCNHVQKGWN